MLGITGQSMPYLGGDGRRVAAAERQRKGSLGLIPLPLASGVEQPGADPADHGDANEVCTVVAGNFSELLNQRIPGNPQNVGEIRSPTSI